MAWVIKKGLNVRILNDTTAPERGLARGLLGGEKDLSVHSLFDDLYVNNLHLHVGALIGILGGLTYLSQRRSAVQGTGNGRDLRSTRADDNGARTDPAL